MTTTKNSMRIFNMGVIAGAALMSACFQPLTNAPFEDDILFLEALPPDDLQVESPPETSLSKKASPETAAGSAQAGSLDAATIAGICTPSQAASLKTSGTGQECDPDLLRQMTVNVADDLNFQIWFILDLLDRIRNAQPTSRTEDSRIWGPWLIPDEDIYIRLEVERSDNLFTYELSLSFNENDMGDVVLDGSYQPGSMSEEGLGEFTFSYTIQGKYFPDQTQVGTMDVIYSTLDMGQDFSAELHGIGQVDETVRMDQSYAYMTPGDGSGFFFFSMPYEIYSNSEETQELEQASAWSSWEANQRGRADLYFTGGNLPDSLGAAVECWNSDQEPVYYYGKTCTTNMGEGAPSQCIKSAIGWNE